MGMKDNTKSYYILSQKQNEAEDELNMYNDMMKDLKDAAKELRKGSPERIDLMTKANEIKNSITYIKLKTKLETLNFAINTVFYLN